VNIVINNAPGDARFDQYTGSYAVNPQGAATGGTFSAAITGIGGGNYNIGFGELPASFYFKGDAVTFTATGEGASSYTYAWSGTHGAAQISGTGATLTITSVSGTIDIICTVTGSAAPPTISSVTVSPVAIEVQQGGTQQFAATVAGTNNPPQTVTWSVTGGMGTTNISTSGLLTVDAAQTTASALTVRATSTADGAKYGEAAVTVTNTPPAPLYAISLEASAYAFPAAAAGYGSQTPLSVTVTNTGNRATGALTVSLSGANPSAFELSAATINSITTVNPTASFTVSPKTGLTAGTYNATVTVSGGNGITANFSVSFTVNPVGAQVHTITFDAGGGFVTLATMQTGADGKLASLPAPTRSGRYRFDGWFTAASGSTQITTGTVFTADATVYARWTYTGGGGGGGAAPVEPVIPGTPGIAVSKATLTYISGQNRVETSVAISRQGWTSAETVILAPGGQNNLIDALAVAPLAGQEKAPILLSTGSLDPAVIAEIQRLSAKKVYAVGAISQTVIDALQAALPGVTVEVLKGSNRFETANLVSAKLTAPQGTFVVGYNAVADAVSAASYAAANGYVIQIASPDGNVSAAPAGEIYILGGPALVQDVPGATRLYGATRYETNKAIRDALTFEYTNIYTADGNTLVDALTGSALAAQTRAAIVLTPGNDPTGVDFGKITQETKVYAFGAAK
jgi:hypothetical protein